MKWLGFHHSCCVSSAGRRDSRCDSDRLAQGIPFEHAGSMVGADLRIEYAHFPALCAILEIVLANRDGCSAVVQHIL
jgi:hypothetical protein